MRSSSTDDSDHSTNETNLLNGESDTGHLETGLALTDGTEETRLAGDTNTIKVEPANIPSSTEVTKTDNMDNDEKKTHSPLRKFNYAGYVKYASLVILTLQNAVLGLSMRYALTRDVVMFSPPAAVLMAEVVKLAICLCLVIQESGGVKSVAMRSSSTDDSDHSTNETNLLNGESDTGHLETGLALTDGTEETRLAGDTNTIKVEPANIPSSTEVTKTDNMDNDEKKTHSPLRKFNYAGYVKYASLVILTLQNAVLGLSMRYALTRDVVMFSPPAAVLMAEVVKLAICLCLVIQESGGVKSGARSLYATVILNIKDTLRVCVPSFLYIVQNNLLYVSSSNLDAATYQVTYQLKLLTTAFFAVIVLKRKLKKWQWCALGILAAGIALVQLSSSDKAAKPRVTASGSESRVLGFCAALAACFISGFAGIYFEKVLKESDISVWMRNVQLSLLSLPFGTVTYLIKEGTLSHLLRGFDGFVWYLVILQAAGGLIVAVVVKYADNILKGFATSVAIIISCIASIYIFEFHLTFQFAMGTMLVIGSIFLYGYVPKKPAQESRSLNV